MIVYKNYSQEHLNYQYNTRLQVPTFATYFWQWENKSNRAAEKNVVHKNVSYGTNERECLDIFPANKPVAKTVVYIHGGYWHLLDKSLFHFIADSFEKENVTTVFINYPLAPTSSIASIVSSCSNALLWVKNNIEQYNGNSSDIQVIGHSAGGHLATMLIMDTRLTFIKSVVSLSGLFRLEPVSLSYINAAIMMNEQTVKDYSPVLLNPAINCPVLLIVGEEESDEFRNQSEELFNTWRNTNNQIQLIEVPGKNHYSILDIFDESHTPVYDAILNTIGIGNKEINL